MPWRELNLKDIMNEKVIHYSMGWYDFSLMDV